MPLSHDLEPVGDAAGEDAAIEDAPNGRADVFEPEPLEEGHGQKAQQPRREKFDAAQGQGVELRGELVHQQYLQREHQGAQEHKGVPLFQGERLCDGQKVEPHGPDDEAQPGPDAGLSVEERGPHDGHQQDIEGGEERTLARGGVLEPHLLEPGGYRHRQPDEDAAFHQPDPVLPGGGQGRLSPQKDEGHETQGPHQHPHGGEGVGRHAVVHGGGLGHEGAAPDHGAAQEDEAVFRLFHGQYPITGDREKQAHFQGIVV